MQPYQPNAANQAAVLAALMRRLRILCASAMPTAGNKNRYQAHLRMVAWQLMASRYPRPKCRSAPHRLQLGHGDSGRFHLRRRCMSRCFMAAKINRRQMLARHFGASAAVVENSGGDRGGDSQRRLSASQHGGITAASARKKTASPVPLATPRTLPSSIVNDCRRL